MIGCVSEIMLVCISVGAGPAGAAGGQGSLTCTATFNIKLNLATTTF